jgi:hypothetical protein
MDRSLDDDQKQHEDLAATVAVAQAPAEHRGEAAVLANLHTLGPGDSDLLAQRLRDFPELHDTILEWAMTHLGNATVHAALAELDKGSATEVAKEAAGDDAFVAEQVEVMAAQKSDEEFVAFQMGVMAGEQQESAQADDGAFVAEQMQEMEQDKGDEEFVAYQMGVMTQEAKDDAFVQEQIGEMAQQQNDEAFVAEQLGVMAQAQTEAAGPTSDDAAFVEEQLGEIAKQQSDEEFARYQIGLMEAEARAEGHAPAEAEAPKKATAEAQPEQQLVEHVAKTPDAEPELLGAALAENPELRQPLVEEATKAQGAEVVEQAIEVEHQEHEQATVAHEEPALTAEVEAQPAVIEKDVAQPEAEEAWAVRAREYNERHPALMARFNELTDSMYAGPDGQVSPDVIVAWQQANGVSVDGRIGPETVAAAKAAKPVPIAEAVQAPVFEEETQEADDEA